MKYELINNEGCLMATTEATTTAKARQFFSESYEGEYKIICSENEESVNVRL